MELPFGLLEYVNAPPNLRPCSICGAPLEWNPVYQEWADYEGGNRHYCTPEFIATLLPDVHECLHCGEVVLVYQDGRRLNADKTPHECKPQPRKPQPKATQPRPTPRKAAYKGPVEI